MRETPYRHTHTLPIYLGFALLTLAALALYIFHFEGRPYRQDEAWRVHGYLSRDVPQTVQWVAGNIHPPLWAMLSDVWVQLAGQMESMTRFLSWLLTALTLALTYRLSADLFSRQVGLLAVFLTATSAFFEFYTSEFRPYALMTTAVMALLLCFIRWLRQPDFKHALLFVAAGVAAIYVHFFSFYALAALMIFFLLFVQWNWRLYLRAAGLFAAIGLSYLGWMLPFLHAVLVSVPGGINYALDSEWWVIERLYPSMTFKPQAISEFLFWVALLGGALAQWRSGRFSRRFRFDPLWRIAYPLALLVGIIGLAFAMNVVVPNLTKRSLVVVFPIAAILLAYGMGWLPRIAQVALAVMIVMPALNFVDYEFTGHHAEVAQFMSPYYQAGDPVIANIPTLSRQVAVLYYVQERMPVKVGSEDILQVLVPGQPYLNFLPAPLINPVYRLNESNLAHLRGMIDGAERVWYIEREGGNLFTEPFLDIIDEQFDEARRKRWANDYLAIEFRRAPGE